MLAATRSTLSESPAQRVSIVIPTLGGSLILQCLESILRNTTGPTYEVVVVANGPSAANLTDAVVMSSPRIRLLHSSANLGFGGGCNRGAAAASGEFLVFLNDDIEVLPDWLEPLVATAERYPDVGAVGSLILSPDGTILEAGSVVWRDGSTVSVGRGASPDDANPYDFQRRVDYCSACCLLVRRRQFQALGGFDECYFPAYYEDVDLCFALARSGFRTLFQPRSRVTHRESASSSLTRKVFLSLRNRETFLRRWAADVAAREPAAPTEPLAVARAVEQARGSRHLLIIDDRPPHRGTGSGFSVLLDAIEALDDSGWAVSVAVSDRIEGDLAILADSGVHVMRQPPDAVLSNLSQTFDRVLISRPNNFDRFARLVREYQPRASLLYLAEALYYRRMQRQLDLATDPAERHRQATEMLEWRRLERQIPLLADEIVCVSDEEAAVLSSVAGHCPISVVRPIVEGIAPTAADFSDRADLLFTPGWLAGDASPNVDALRWFVTEVLPRLLDARPDMRLRVTGADPPPAARALTRPGVEFLGFTPELRTQYEAVRIAIVPMRVGAGVKLKCLEALQYGVPVVSTSVGAEGLGLHDSRAVIVNDDPRDFAASLLRLYDSPEAWTRQREVIRRVGERWRKQARPMWRRALARLPGDHQYASGNFPA